MSPSSLRLLLVLVVPLLVAAVLVVALVVVAVVLVAVVLVPVVGGGGVVVSSVTFLFERKVKNRARGR